MTARNRNPYMVSTVRCAAPGCMNVRQQTNHWFVVSFDEFTFSCRPYAAGRELTISEEPVCGQACAQRLFERFLGKKDL